MGEANFLLSKIISRGMRRIPQGINMLKYYFFFILLLFSPTLYAQPAGTESKLIMVVKHWNDANNAKDTNTLSRLYAKTIIYYGRRLPLNQCIGDKKRFFRKYPYFHQSIQNIAYASIGKNVYRIIFDKNVRIKRGSKRKLYPSYIQVDTSTTLPRIVEEGDSVTDKNIKRNKSIPVYTLGGIHALSGQVKTVLQYGPPGYGENPQADQKITAFVLKLKDPIHVVSLKGDEVNFSTQANEIQLVASDYLPQLKNIADSGRFETFRGEIFSAHSGYHIRDVLMEVKSIVLH